MMAGMDDKEDPEDYITIEAMSGLSRVLVEIQEEHIRAILINISLKIRPCFEKVHSMKRAIVTQIIFTVVKSHLFFVNHLFFF